jgi:hypothetical protein
VSHPPPKLIVKSAAGRPFAVRDGYRFVSKRSAACVERGRHAVAVAERLIGANRQREPGSAFVINPYFERRAANIDRAGSVHVIGIGPVLRYPNANAGPPLVTTTARDVTRPASHRRIDSAYRRRMMPCHAPSREGSCEPSISCSPTGARAGCDGLSQSCWRSDAIRTPQPSALIHAR